MTRLDYLAKLARFLGKNTTLDTTTSTRLQDHLNNRIREICSLPGRSGLRRRTVTCGGAANVSLVALPDVEDVDDPIRELTNDRALHKRSFAAYRQRNPDPAANPGTPEGFVPIGYTFVAKQPSAAVELFVKSSSVSDTAVVAYVDGSITTGFPRVASVTLTGTTAVTLGATITSWEGLTDFYLSVAPVGVVTLHETSGSGTEIARIGIGQTRTRYYAFHLDPTPSDAITYYADALYAIRDLAQDTAEPPLPLDFHDLPFYGAVMDELMKAKDERFLWAERRWRERSTALDLRLARQSVGTAKTPGAQRLGAWTPISEW